MVIEFLCNIGSSHLISFRIDQVASLLFHALLELAYNSCMSSCAWVSTCAWVSGLYLSLGRICYQDIALFSLLCSIIFDLDSFLVSTLSLCNTYSIKDFESFHHFNSEQIILTLMTRFFQFAVCCSYLC